MSIVDERSKPIFVLGAARSGTTALALGLRRALQGPVEFQESHVFPLLDKMMTLVADYYDGFPEGYLGNGKIMLDAFSREKLEEHIRTFFIDTAHATFEGTPVWVDKTPGDDMIRIAPFLAEIYPHAKFIFIRRRAIELILSRKRKFEETSHEDSCRVWHTTMQRWCNVRRRLGARAMEIDQRSMALEPARTAEQVGAFLGFQGEQIARLADSWNRQRPQMTQRPMDNKSIDLDETPWSTEERNQCRTICGPMMERFGYRFEGEHFETDPAKRILVKLPADLAGVAVTNVIEGGLGETKDGLLLHPPSPGEEPAQLVFRAIKFDGHNSFSSWLRVNHERSAPVVFAVVLQNELGEEIVRERSGAVSPDVPAKWAFDFPALYGKHKVTFSTEMAEGAPNNSCAHAVWTDPGFIVRPAADEEQDAQPNTV